MSNSLESLNLTRDEVEKIGAALKDKEFRKLFADYVDEINNPENKKLYQSEVIQLERERGNDVKFINPVAGYVIKTSVEGNKKAFINVCSNEHVKKPTSKPSFLEGSKGLQWSLPYSLSPPREDVDNKRIKCTVYDVVFHPDTLHLAQSNKAFRNMVNKTAVEAIESNYCVQLDNKNLIFPKLNYKGTPQATIIRTPSKEPPSEKSAEDQEILNKIYENIPKAESPKKKVANKTKSMDDLKSKFTTPKYLIKHRSHLDLEEFTYDRKSKINSAIPKELVIEIDLPLLKAASDIDLDVTEKSVQLTSEKPAKYKLSLTLPYHVNESTGNAKFDKDTKKLTIVLSVKRNDVTIDDSGVESDHGSPISTPVSTPATHKSFEEVIKESAFLNPNIQYILPEYTCHLNDDLLTFVLNIKNVNQSSVEKSLKNEYIHLTLTSISSGFYPVNYALYVKVPKYNINTEKVLIEVWDNNVTVQIPLKPCDNKLTSYLIGINENQLFEKTIDDNSTLSTQEVSDKNYTNEDTTTTFTNAQRSKEVQKANVIVDTIALKEEPIEKFRTRAISIDSNYSESSGDELSYSYSPSKSKGILKRISTSRKAVSRSISESSLDDLTWTSSFENCCASMDSFIPEDGEVSTSLKKTVRFNDNVSRQLFRSNSSILGQKKKNQRKARNKKRAQERRFSESELSESEDKKEKQFLKRCSSKVVEEAPKEDAQIFDFDM